MTFSYCGADFICLKYMEFCYYYSYYNFKGGIQNVIFYAKRMQKLNLKCSSSLCAVIRITAATMIFFLMRQHKLVGSVVSPVNTCSSVAASWLFAYNQQLCHGRGCGRPASNCWSPSRQLRSSLFCLKHLQGKQQLCLEFSISHIICKRLSRSGYTH